MEILDFINSTTLRTYLKSINYTPTTTAAAFIVWQSKDHTIFEKEEMLLEIAENMPDECIPPHEFHAGRGSAREFIREYNAYVRKSIRAFKANTGGGVYSFSAYYTADRAWVSDENLYSSFDKVISEVKLFLRDGVLPRLIRIRRRVLDLDLGSDYLYLTPTLEYYRIERASETMSDAERELTGIFTNMAPYIPHPFKVGDVIKECAGRYALSPYYCDTLTVTDFYSEDYVRTHQHILGMHDFTIFGVCDCGNGDVYEDSIDHYLNAERIS